MKKKMYETLLEVATERYLEDLEAVATECEAEGKPTWGADYELRTEPITEAYEREVNDILFDARCNGLLFQYTKGKWKPIYGFCNWSKMSGVHLRFV